MSLVYGYKLCTSCKISHIYKLRPDMTRTSTMVFLPIVLHPQAEPHRPLRHPAARAAAELRACAQPVLGGYFSICLGRG